MLLHKLHRKFAAGIEKGWLSEAILLRLSKIHSAVMLERSEVFRGVKSADFELFSCLFVKPMP
jgi:hypothetical protein